MTVTYNYYTSSSSSSVNILFIPYEVGRTYNYYTTQLEPHYKTKQNQVFLKEILPHPKDLPSRHYEEKLYFQVTYMDHIVISMIDVVDLWKSEYRLLQRNNYHNSNHCVLYYTFI